MPIPAEVGTGTVTGLFLEVDGTPLVDGEITFRPSPQRLTVPEAPAMILPSVVVATTNVDGVLWSDGAPGVTLIATDDESVQPHGWTWQVAFDFRGKRWAPQPFQFSFELATGATVDLAEVTPVAASNGESIIQGPPGEPGAGASPSSVDLAAIIEGGA